MRPTVIYDANVLYPSVLRDVLIRTAQYGVVQARWTERILDEVFNNLKANRPDLKDAALQRTRALMNESIRDVRVENFDALEAQVSLPDEKDRHVVAAAIRAEATTIVTANTRDFPASALAPWGIDAEHPDTFLMKQLDTHVNTMRIIVEEISRATSRPPLNFNEILNQLERSGAPETARHLRR